MRDELGLTEEKEFVVKENTLVIADTFGIHRRKPSEPGKARNSINAHHRNLWPFSVSPGFNVKSFNRLSQKIYDFLLRF